MTWLPRRSVRKHRVQRVTVGLFSFYLLQRVGGSVGLGVASSWLQWLLMLFISARRCVDSVIADLPVSRDARGIPRLCSLSDALTRGRLSRLGLAERSALQVKGSVTALRLGWTGALLSRATLFATMTTCPLLCPGRSHSGFAQFVLKVKGSCLAVHFASSPYCLSSETFLRYSMSSPRRSWRGCRRSPTMWLPMPYALLLIVHDARLDVSWPLDLEVLDDRRFGTSWTVGLLQDNASWMPQPVDRSLFLAGNVILWHSGFRSVAVPGLRR